MKKLRLSVIVFTAINFLTSTAAHAELGCVFDEGESFSNTCEVEQAQLDKAREGLEIARQYNYCRVSSPDKPNGVGLQCRTFTLYKNTDGKITRDFFTFRFYAGETHRTVSNETFYIKREDGLHDSMHDEITDNISEVNNQLPEWRGVDVSFDRNDFPSYIAKFVTPSGDPSIPDTVAFSMIIYSESEVVLIQNVDKPENEQTKIVYGAIGPIQFPFP